LCNAAEHKLFSSRSIIFEEGIGHRTCPPAGGDVEIDGRADHNVPIPLPESQTDVIAELPIVDDPAAPADVPAPALPAPHRSTHIHVPSKAIQQSFKSQEAEAAVKAAGTDWATSRKSPINAPRQLLSSTFQLHWCLKTSMRLCSTPEVWMGPMEKDYGSLMGWEVWVLVNPPPGVNVIDCKWVYVVKYDIEGKITKWKA
jgi:hypothetical protein